MTGLFHRLSADILLTLKSPPTVACDHTPPFLSRLTWANRYASACSCCPFSVEGNDFSIQVSTASATIFGVNSTNSSGDFATFFKNRCR